ncbi:hypothetical protein [Arthrobacter sp. HMWF013]|uniref:hypothetical protein n=1 Tax=Arthrobacter sp. HMWF013 TaxID=2056849 RepID=UPI000D33C9DE|nr:hypothetical protein [Arthrobacter sp. HMWF013]PTT70797.1 hypothetical protein DBR22_00255 [Arthrobacter sp. HMWF013]
MTSRLALEKRIRYELSTLAETNSHHDFEAICLGLARKRIATNLMPATGPVSAGGDQGRDAESFWSNLPTEATALSTFALGATQENVVLACTIQQAHVPTKIRADLGSICTQGERVDRVVFFTLSPVPVAKRHELQRQARDRHGISLDIWDGVAVARELSEHDLYHLAVDYLHLPSDLAPERPVPESPRPDWYVDALSRWTTRQDSPSTIGDLIDLREGLRLASTDPLFASDLPNWLTMAKKLLRNANSDDVTARAQFEIAWATMRGTETLMPADDLVREFFNLVPGTLEDPGILRDATMLLDLGYAAMLRRTTGIDRCQLETWHQALADTVDALLLASDYPNTRAMLLSLQAYLALHQRYPAGILPELGEVPTISDTLAALRDKTFSGTHQGARGIELMDVDKGMEALGELIELLPKAPLFPVRDTADIFGLYTSQLVDHPLYEKVRDGLDDALERIEGESGRGSRALNRALRLIEVDRLLDALHELHAAKINWWHGDTLEGSIEMFMLISRIYYQLNLPHAGKQYALAAMTAAQNANDPSLKHFVTHGLMVAATCDHHAGQSLTATHSFNLALLAQSHFGDGSARFELHAAMTNMLQDQCHIFRAAQSVRPDLVPLLTSLLDSTTVMDAITAMLDGVRGIAPMTEPEIAAATDRSGMGRLFSDIGPTRYYRWAALGLTWQVQCKNERQAVLATERFIATTQIVLTEFARHDAHLLLEALRIEVSVDARNGQGGAGWVDWIADQQGGHWNLHLTPGDSADLEALQLESLGAAMHFLASQSLLNQGDFSSIMDASFAGGLWHKSSIVRSYDELADLAEASTYAEFSQRREVFVGWIHPSEIRNPSADMQKRQGLASSYEANRNKILENIAYRYATLPAVIGPALVLLHQDARFRSTVERLRQDGWLDWHLLQAIANIVVNDRAETRGIRLSRNMTDNEKQGFINLIHEPARTSDPVLPTTAFTEDRLRLHLSSAAVSGLTTLGLTLHKKAVPTEPILNFLGERYRYWVDDSPHQPYFPGTSAS